MLIQNFEYQKAKGKSKEELITIKEEVETLNKKLTELTDKELEQVYGGLKLDPDRLREKIKDVYPTE